MGRRGKPLAERSARTVVLAALRAETWTPAADVLNAVEAAGYPRDYGHVRIYRMHKAGFIERRGDSNQSMEYRLPATSSGARVETAITFAVNHSAPHAPQPEAVAAGEAVIAARLAPSLGLVCGAPPMDSAQDRIEDAIAAILDPHTPITLDALLARLPARWSRAEAVSALADGVLDDWIGAKGDPFRTEYWLRKAPPAARVDPLAEQFKAMRLRARLEEIDRGLSELLQQPEIRRTSDIGKALTNAHTNTQYALTRITV